MLWGYNSQKRNGCKFRRINISNFTALDSTYESKADEMPECVRTFCGVSASRFKNLAADFEQLLLQTPV